ncbi:MAG: phytoene desaturase family protein [bacterium]
MKKVVVCGAGIGGMVSAIYLANNKYEVEIFEKNLTPGGKINEFRTEGFRFDTGPSLITMPYVLEQFFTDIDRNITDYLDLIELESSCKYFWNDGSVFNSYSDENKLKKELRKIFGESEETNYFRYLKYGKLFYELSKDNFLNNDFKIRNYISKEGLKNFTKFISGRSVNDVSNKFFKDKRLKQLMDRYATYNGSSPYLAPQFFSIIPYVENRFGAWYIKGGIYKLAKALEKLCSEFNIPIKYGHELSDIETGDKKNISKLFFKTNGTGNIQKDNFDYLISNFTNNKQLVGDNYFENDDWSCSGFIMCLGMNKEYRNLSHHNILFSDNYEMEFIKIFEKKIPADDMTIYISITKRDEPGDAPENCDNWFILVNAPCLTNNFEWTEENKNKYSSMIIDKLDSFTYLFEDSIKNHIKFCKVFSPNDFLADYNSEFGSIYGLSSNSLYTLMKRPRNASKKFTNLFFVGGNTHPGGGIPLCFLSGRIVSNLVG